MASRLGDASPVWAPGDALFRASDRGCLGRVLFHAILGKVDATPDRLGRSGQLPLELIARAIAAQAAVQTGELDLGGIDHERIPLSRMKEEYG